MGEHRPEVFPLYVKVQSHQFGQVERQTYHDVPPNIPSDRLIPKVGPGSRELRTKKWTKWHRPALIEIPEPWFVPQD
jgi:hypothetical protein